MKVCSLGENNSLELGESFGHPLALFYVLRLYRLFVGICFVDGLGVIFDWGWCLLLFVILSALSVCKKGIIINQLKR